MSQDGWPPPAPRTPPGPPNPAPSATPPTARYDTPPPAAQEPENRPRGLVIGAIVAVLALAGVVVFLLVQALDDDEGDADPAVPTAVEGSVAGSVAASIPAATQEPTGLGDDEGFNGLAQDCYDGEMQACDDLYNTAEDDSAYRRYGDTCAGRQPEGTRRFCTDSFPEG